jgi:hypothetical protein
MRYETRLRRLEARIRARPQPPYAVIDALQQAISAAVRAKLARRLEGMDDAPEQEAQLTALLDQWRALGMARPTGARARITERLDRMDERLRAYTLSDHTP